MDYNQTLPVPTPLTQLLRLHAPENINSFAGWLVGLPTLRSLDDLSPTDRVFIRERIETDGANLARYWQASRTHTPLSDEQQAAEWLR